MIRRRSLPPGWYPATGDGVRDECRRWESESAGGDDRFLAVVVPHAGWAFSGRIAFAALRALAPPVETIVVAGGHLHAGDPVLLAPEARYETPLGELQVDPELSDHLVRAIRAAPDRTTDNTVEVQLPIIRYLFPDARIVYLRCPPGERSIDAGRVIAEYALEHGVHVRFVGSTDLTHYGPSYGFAPVGEGPRAARWVRETNDRAIIDAMRRMDASETIRLGNDERAACSSGAAAAAIAFARRLGVRTGELIEYAQSCDVRPDSSFVGYAGIGFSAFE